jgi:hypothetical protein
MEAFTLPQNHAGSRAHLPALTMGGIKAMLPFCHDPFDSS